jgi:hypothetical protein
MEPEGSLQGSQESATGPYLKPNESTTIPHIHFNVSLPIIPRSLQWSLSFPFRFSYAFLSHACYTTCIYHLPRLDHPNNIRLGLHITNLLRRVCYYQIIRCHIPEDNNYSHCDENAFVCQHSELCSSCTAKLRQKLDFYPYLIKHQPWKNMKCNSTHC